MLLENKIKLPQEREINEPQELGIGAGNCVTERTATEWTPYDARSAA
jgi:hypothetical protein